MLPQGISKNILRKAHQSHLRHKPGFLTISALAKKLGVSRTWIHDRIKIGTIKLSKDPELKCYLVPDTEQTLDKFRAILSAFEQKMARRKGHQHD